MEKRDSNHPWIDHTWRAVAVIPGAPPLDPRGVWKVLESGQGYVRCAVDFEPENVLGARFWLRAFQPVCYSLFRQVDERAAG